MIATMDIMGVITITAESGAESFALYQWAGKAEIRTNIPTPHGQRSAWSSQHLRIETKYEQEKK